MKAGEINISLKELLGERVYTQYMKKIILPLYKERYATGKLTLEELASVVRGIDAKDVGILNSQLFFSPSVTRNNIKESGWIAETVHYVTNTLAIRVMVKKNADKEGFINELKTYRSLTEIVKGTEYAKFLPSRYFANSWNRFILTPFVEGEVLTNKLHQCAPIVKEELLKKTIDDYTMFFGHLNSSSIKSQFKLPNRFMRFEAFFELRYGGNFEFGELFKTEIADELNAACTDHIHGDFHPGNTVVNGHHTFLDLENAASNGFAEFDLGKLFTKANLSFEEEDRLINYFAVKMRGDTQEAVDKSYRLYTKNQITQELVSAKRYLNAAKGIADPEERNRQMQMANIFYSTAQRRMTRAVDKGIITARLQDAITRITPVGLENISDEVQFQKMRSTYNPYIFPSQKNRQIPLTAVVHRNAEDLFTHIEKKIDRSWYVTLAKRIGMTAAGLLVLGTAAYFIIRGQSADEHYVKEFMNTTISSDARLYSRIFSDTYDKVNYEVGRESVTDVFSEDGSFVKDTLARQSGIPDSLITRILHVNKLYAYASKSSGARPANSANIFDPLLMNEMMGDYVYPVVSFDSTLPEDILSLKTNGVEGIKRLTSIAMKYLPPDATKYGPHGDANDALRNVFTNKEILKQVLVEWYSPPGSLLEKNYVDRPELINPQERMAALRKNVKTIVFNILEHVGYDKWIGEYITEAPDTY